MIFLTPYKVVVIIRTKPNTIQTRYKLNTKCRLQTFVIEMKKRQEFKLYRKYFFADKLNNGRVHEGCVQSCRTAPGCPAPGPGVPEDPDRQTVQPRCEPQLHLRHLPPHLRQPVRQVPRPQAHGQDCRGKVKTSLSTNLSKCRESSSN